VIAILFLVLRSFILVVKKIYADRMVYFVQVVDSALVVTLNNKVTRISLDAIAQKGFDLRTADTMYVSNFEELSYLSLKQAC
jgi:hypothetical protein